MISTKTFATLLFITLHTQLVSSSGTQETNPFGKSSLQLRRHVHAPGTNKSVLVDTTSKVVVVNLIGEGIGKSKIPQEQPVPPINNEFSGLIDQGKYKEIFDLGKKMNMKLPEFMTQLSLVVTTLEQYKGIVDYLKQYKIVHVFYVYGSIGVIKKVIVESKAYDIDPYVKNDPLNIALPLALNDDHHDRFISLLNVRKSITAEKDVQRKQQGKATSFEIFVYNFIGDLTPWKNGVALKRFLTLHGHELRDKYPDIMDVLCQKLVAQLKIRYDEPIAEKFLVDLVGQPFLLNPTSFTRGFFSFVDDTIRSFFIKHGWHEAIEEGLKKEYEYGGEELWRLMTIKFPEKFSGPLPSTVDAFAAVLRHFPTKQQKEKEWIEKNAPGFFGVGPALADIFPIDLVSIVLEYARPTWTDI